MNWVDGVMLAVVALSALAGLLRGLAREMLGLAAWVAAAVLAAGFYPVLLPFAQRWIDDGLVAEAVCLAVTFILILIALSIVASLLSRLVRLSLLGGIDRILGLVFGAVRGAALLVLAYIVLGLALPKPDWPDPLYRARAMPWLQAGARFVLDRAPERWRADLPNLGPRTPASDQESF